MNTVIAVENLFKCYRLGQIGGGSLVRDLNRWWARTRKQPDPYLKLDQVDHSHRIGEEIWALKDVSFTVEQGEVLGIIGRNGAGKSTLLKILSRVTAPTSGLVRVKGRIASLLEVGTGFHPELTGRENIFLNGAILGMSNTEVLAKFDEIVGFAEIEQFIDTPVKRYSSGMYVRLAFAVAAHLEPEILVVDEVLAVGDASFQKKCLGKMSEVSQTGRTILFVSHNMPAVLKLCSRSLLISSGQISASGDTQDIVYKYMEEGISPSEEKTFVRNPDLPATELAFTKVRVLDHNLKPTAYIDATQGFNIEIHFEVSKSIRKAQVSFSLWNNEGICILTSTDLDQPNTEIERTLDVGGYQATCHVPAAFIRPGKYTIDLGSSVPGIKILDIQKQCITIEAVDHGTAMSRLSQGRQGIIAPVLEWRLELKNAQ